MKKGFYIILMIFMVGGLWGCGNSSNGNDENTQESPKPVEVMEVKEETHPLYLEYVGSINPEGVKQYSFKNAGKVERVYVEKGQRVTMGQPLMQLDLEDLNAALRAAQAQVDGALSQYNKGLAGASEEEIKQVELNVTKAQLAYDHILERNENIEALYEAGGISKQERDNAQLELDLRESELQMAKEAAQQIRRGTRQEDQALLLAQLEMARADYEHKESLIEDATLRASTDAYIEEVLFKEGEMVGAGYPVVILRSEGQLVKTGIAQQDRSKIHTGSPVVIKGNQIETRGEMTYLHATPEQRTLTYEAEVSLGDHGFLLGEIVKLRIEVGEETGIRIPIQGIMSDQRDYVFVVEEGRVTRRDIQRLEVRGSQVMVSGLEDGDKLVVQGMKNVKVGDPVTIHQ